MLTFGSSCLNTGPRRACDCVCPAAAVWHNRANAPARASRRFVIAKLSYRTYLMVSVEEMHPKRTPTIKICSLCGDIGVLAVHPEASCRPTAESTRSYAHGN